MKMEFNTKMGSKTYQYRKVTKPLLERKRRARINKCLDDLKDLMIECIRQQGDNIARLEKADILELTVEHLRKMKSDKLNQVNKSSSEKNIDSFKSGYIHAANEVSRALSLLPRVDIKLGTKVMTHLGHRLNQIQQQDQCEKLDNIIPNRIVNSTQMNGVTQLSVYCGSGSDSYYQRETMISPSSSSGYGSDSEFVSLSSSNQIWRPW